MSLRLRTARADDAPLISQLWEVCFPGDSDFVSYFLMDLYNPDLALLCVTGDDRPAAMLHMIPYTFSWLGNGTSLFYIYAVGTHPDFRRRGLASSLILRAISEMHGYGALFAALIPQEDWLFDFYRLFGFAPVCPFSPLAYEFTSQPIPARDEDIPLLNSLYEDSLPGRPHMLRSPSDWLSILRECSLGGGNVLLDGESGYAVFPRPDAPPTEAFGPGASATGPLKPFACIRPIDAKELCRLAAQSGLEVPADYLEDPQAPWNTGALLPAGIPNYGRSVDVLAFTDSLFSGNPPYIQHLHN